MTIDQFFKLLEKTTTNGSWRIVDGRTQVGRNELKRIRRIKVNYEYGWECPITAVANHRARRFRFHTGEAGAAARYVGLGSRATELIIKAADRDRVNASTDEVRKRILTTVRLEGVTPEHGEGHPGG